MTLPRTDLALERHARMSESIPSLPGLQVNRHTEGQIEVTEIRVTSPEAAHALNKPEGTYITLDLKSKWQQDEDLILDMAHKLARALRPLLPKDGSILTVGLGNRMVTADALGPAALDKLIVTRHLQHTFPGLFDELRTVAAIAPGVMGRTGMEPIELIAGIVDRLHPSAVIAIDALAAASLDRLGSSFQISTCGIIPGEGARSKRQALNRETLGVPVLAIGVPTVTDAATLACDLLDLAHPPRLLEEGFLVTPGDIDLLILKAAKAVGYGINLALHGDLSVSDMEGLLA
ncbi:MAG: GPR endopeptidase [Clostridia bacterium]|nr:GPR endopeptidase [Clostridia bacterium]